MRTVYVSPRSCTVLIDENGDYYARCAYRSTLNGEAVKNGQRSVLSLYGLWPDTEYTLECVFEDQRTERLSFRTAAERCTFDVRRFGAIGDGTHDDTAALQAAILCCPEGGRVLVPRGRYLTGPLFLKSHLTLELAEGAVLCLTPDRGRFPVLPGMTRTTDEKGEVLLGSWEGNPLDTYASALTGIGVIDVAIIGKGVIDGQGQDGVWWTLMKKAPVGPYRPRLFYLKNCSHITVQGITFRNSPCWNLHPAFSEDLQFLSVTVEAPYESPNTDGFDPESCRHVRMYGSVISVGDDCVAIKSGKIYMGTAYHTPCEDIDISWCLMQHGHGGVTVGSEMAGGVRDVTVRHCRMIGNDRGLRIKTRRGRGKYGVIDNIRFEDVLMEGVKAPLVVNALYRCDPDGTTAYVQSREPQPVDDRTPAVGSIVFERVRAENCEACAAYILGLPEKPVEEIVLRDCGFVFAGDPQPMEPAMASNVGTCAGEGIFALNVNRLRLERVSMSGIRGRELNLDHVTELQRIDD